MRKKNRNEIPKHNGRCYIRTRPDFTQAFTMSHLLYPRVRSEKLFFFFFKLNLLNILGEVMYNATESQTRIDGTDESVFRPRTCFASFGFYLLPGIRFFDLGRLPYLLFCNQTNLKLFGIFFLEEWKKNGLVQNAPTDFKIPAHWNWNHQNAEWKYDAKSAVEVVAVFFFL